MSSTLIVGLLKDSKVAFKAGEVVEIVHLPLLQTLPSKHPAFLGSMNYRGEILSIYDLCLLMKGASLELNTSTKIIILKDKDNMFGVAISNVLDAVQLEKTRKAKSSDASDKSCRDSVVLYKENFIPLLKAEEIKKDFEIGVDKNDLSPRISENIISNFNEREISLLEKRAKSLAKREMNSKQNNVGILVVRINDEYIGFSNNSIKEVSDFQEITLVPGTMDEIEGIIALRGEVIPVISASKTLFAESSSSSSEKMIILFKYSEETYGIAVNFVEDLVYLDSEDIEPANFLSNKFSEFSKGQVVFNERILTLIDPVEIFEKQIISRKDIA